MFLFFVTMATKQWNRQQFYKKNDIVKPNYLLTAQVYMNNALRVLIINTCF